MVLSLEASHNALLSPTRYLYQSHAQSYPMKHYSSYLVTTGTYRQSVIERLGRPTEFNYLY
jgi:hypothetical protein